MIPKDLTPYELSQLEKYGNILPADGSQNDSEDEAEKAFKEWNELQAELTREDDENNFGNY